jgi:hypothetical protein
MRGQFRTNWRRCDVYFVDTCRALSTHHRAHTKRTEPLCPAETLEFPLHEVQSKFQMVETSHYDRRALLQIVPLARLDAGLRVYSLLTAQVCAISGAEGYILITLARLPGRADSWTSCPAEVPVP